MTREFLTGALSALVVDRVICAGFLALMLWRSRKQPVTDDREYSLRGEVVAICGKAAER